VVEAPAESVTSTQEWRPSLLEMLPHHFVLRAAVDQGTLLRAAVVSWDVPYRIAE
jgi:hypothetical protein